MVVVLGAAIGTAQLAPAEDSLDQGSGGDEVSYLGAFVAGGGIDIAQTFTVGRDGLLGRVEISVARLEGTTAPLTVEVRPTTGGLPDPTEVTILARASVKASEVPPFSATAEGPYDFKKFAFVGADLSSSKLRVKRGQVLAITLRSEATSGGYAWALGPGDPGPYAGGQGFFRAHRSRSDAFNRGGGDQYFRAYVEPGPTDPRDAKAR